MIFLEMHRKYLRTKCLIYFKMVCKSHTHTTVTSSYSPVGTSPCYQVKTAKAEHNSGCSAPWQLVREVPGTKHTPPTPWPSQS